MRQTGGDGPSSAHCLEMKMKRLVSASVLAAAMFFAGGASAATVVDFKEFAHTNPAKNYGRNITSGGLTLHSDGSQGFGNWGMSHTSNADPGSAAMMNWGGGFVTIRRTGGGLFNLASIDLADANDSGRTLDITFVFFDGVSTQTQKVALDTRKGLETFTFNRNVEWFRIEPPTRQNLQFDNIRWDEPVLSAVPEPASWAMMIVGFGAGGAMIRRSRALAAGAKLA